MSKYASFTKCRFSSYILYTFELRYKYMHLDSRRNPDRDIFSDGNKCKKKKEKEKSKIHLRTTGPWKDISCSFSHLVTHLFLSLKILQSSAMCQHLLAWSTMLIAEWLCFCLSFVSQVFHQTLLEMRQTLEFLKEAWNTFVSITNLYHSVVHLYQIQIHF